MDTFKQTGESVRIEATLTVSVNVILTEDEYDRWLNGDVELVKQVRERISAEAAEEEAGFTEEIVVKRAVLVENDGYLGTDVAVLKTFS